jgi:hypothetical protein
MNSASPVPQWPEAPYKGLSFYTPEDVALFAGRQRDVRDCARLLTRDRTKVLLLQGRSGNGKSSFLRAGLIPYLESKVPVFSFLRFDITKTHALFIQCTDKPLFRLCEKLYDWTQAPFPVDIGEDERLFVDLAEIRGDADDRTAFVNQNATSVPNLMAVLRKIHEILPKWLILVIALRAEPTRIVLSERTVGSGTDRGNQDSHLALDTGRVSARAPSAGRRV